MINQADDEFGQYNPVEFINNWVPTTVISGSLTPKVPFKKLKIFTKKNLNKSYEASIYRLYLQKVYLVFYAHMISARLQFSKKLYERNGMIFGLFYLCKEGQNARHRFKGVDMIQCNVLGGENLKEAVQDIFEEMKAQIDELKLFNMEEYDHSFGGITQLLNEDGLSPKQFLKKFEKLPLTEHYIHKVRLQNALLSSVFKDQHENLLATKMSQEHKILDNLFYGHGQTKEAYQDLEKILEEIHSTLYNNGKIGTAMGPDFKRIKTYRGKTFEKNFAIILSQYRMEVVTNQKKIEESQPVNSTNSKDRSWTKIEITSKNGALQPISGNVIFVKFIWEVIPEQHKTFLEVHCCNNRKVQEMYYNEILQFWETLEKDPRFRALTGIDKYFIELNQQKQSMQVIFNNFVPFCILTNALKEIDKIVALALSMDEIIEICERKGLQKQGQQNLEIKPYMIEEVINKFKWSLDKIEKQSSAQQMAMI